MYDKEVIDLEMKDFIIVTDATCDLTREYLTSNNVECMPMLYSVDGKDYYMMGESNGLEMDEFYAQMRKGSVTKTAQINPDRAAEFLTPFAERGCDILYIGFSSALSGTANNVINCLNELKEKFPDQDFYGVDSLCASMGEGLMVHYAVTMRKEGKSVLETYEFLKEHRQNFCHYFTVDDLHFLQRGGRVSKLTAIVGTLLNIKPVLHVSPEGKLINIAKVRGRQKSLRMLVEKMRVKIEGTNQPVFISHGDCADDANFVAQLVTEEFGITDITLNYIGPVVGAHSGPGTVALFFFGKDRKE